MPIYWRRKWQLTVVFFPQEIPWTEEPGVHGVAKKIDIEDYIKVKWIKEVADKIS